MQDRIMTSVNVLCVSQEILKVTQARSKAMGSVYSWEDDAQHFVFVRHSTQAFLSFMCKSDRGHNARWQSIKREKSAAGAQDSKCAGTRNCLMSNTQTIRKTNMKWHSRILKCDKWKAKWLAWVAHHSYAIPSDHFTMWRLLAPHPLPHNRRSQWLLLPCCSIIYKALLDAYEKNLSLDATVANGSLSTITQRCALWCCVVQWK